METHQTDATENIARNLSHKLVVSVGHHSAPALLSYVVQQREIRRQRKPERERQGNKLVSVRAKHV